jgi:hypothetical protein
MDEITSILEVLRAVAKLATICWPFVKFIAKKRRTRK